MTEQTAQERLSKNRRVYGFFKEKMDRIVAWATRKGDKKQDEKNPLIIRKIKEEKK